MRPRSGGAADQGGIVRQRELKMTDLQRDADALRPELTEQETERLLPHAIDYLTQADWEQGEKKLALALATQQVVDENAERVRQIATRILAAKRGRA
jgi:hypothetical protein